MSSMAITVQLFNVISQCSVSLAKPLLSVTYRVYCLRSAHHLCSPFTRVKRAFIPVYGDGCQVQNVRSLSHTSGLSRKKSGTSMDLFSVFRRLEPPARGLKEVQELVPASTDEDEDSEVLLNDPEYEQIKAKADALLVSTLSEIKHRSDGVVVLQPWIKWGHRKRRDTLPELLLEEACALIRTLPGLRIELKEVVNVMSTKRSNVFGTGMLDRLAEEIKARQSVCAVFISVDVLKKTQIRSLQEIFETRVFDRYLVVLGIFHLHARTAEAKLQVALAELPYIRNRVVGELERNLFMEREKQLRKALQKVSSQRELLRRGRLKASMPSVAIVGYTNCGKTTLINALTGDERAQGRNQLFATLDVTVHRGKLPCGLSVLFVDTVGFIQDIPTGLIASFDATLQDAVFADVIVHVKDASHPDISVHTETVQRTLSKMAIPEGTPIITVNNKVDLLSESHMQSLCQEGAGEIAASAKTGEGLVQLLHVIEDDILRVTGRQLYHFQLPTGCSEISWLRTSAGLAEERVDEENPQFTNVIAVMNEQELAAFMKAFRIKSIQV